MRYALIIAGGSGTRLWPMSTKNLPKQLIPFIDGRSLLQVSLDRLKGLVPTEQIFVCAGQSTRKLMLDSLPDLSADRFLGEPTGRDTLNAVALGTAVIGRADPQATVAVMTADHLIEPVDQFQRIVGQGYSLAEKHADMLVTFGITPTHAATSYGYLQLGRAVGEHNASIVDVFQEKPQLATAEEYLKAGAQRYLWNSGMFVWQAKTLLDCVQRYTPENYQQIMQVIDAWDSDRRASCFARVYPQLNKISVDYAVMEPASRDDAVRVAAVPMELQWLDVGSWPAFAKTCTPDEAGNVAAGCRHLLMDTHNTLVASNDPNHLITTIGCADLIVVHTPTTTLVCKSQDAEQIKKLHEQVGRHIGEEHL